MNYNKHDIYKFVILKIIELKEIELELEVKKYWIERNGFGIK